MYKLLNFKQIISNLSFCVFRCTYVSTFHFNSIFLNNFIEVYFTYHKIQPVLSDYLIIFSKFGELCDHHHKSGFEVNTHTVTSGLSFAHEARFE